MIAKTLKVLEGTDTLTKGDLENVTVTDDRIILDSVAGRHVLYGCYTSIPLSMPQFDALVMSWNADTPEGTAVEAQARVMVDGNWSVWVDFGRWSPYIKRSSGYFAQGPLVMDRDILYLDSKTADQVQLRIYLYTDNEVRTPSVRLLSASVRRVQSKPEKAPKLGNRQLRVPSYSQLLRAPSLSDTMDLACCLAGMMNRYGEDVLPEELGLAMYDWEGHTCANRAFTAAVAGCWGYYAHLAFMELSQLWEEIRSGFAAAVEINYTSDPERAGPGLPWLAESMCDAQRHWVVVTGFTEIDQTVHLLVNDSLCPTDAQCARIWPLEDFLEAWTGLGLVLHKKDRRYGLDKPQRQTVQIQPNPESELPDNYILTLGGKPYLLPQDFCGTPQEPTGVLAVTYTDGIARATTAHKAFRFVPVVDGGLFLAKGEKKTKKTVYALNFTGSMMVGDILV